MFHPVDRVLGNLGAFPLGARRLERVEIPSDALARRVLRLETSVGDLGLQLGDARLRDGDVVYADERVVVAVAVSTDEVLVVRPRSVAEALLVGHALGNRHIPLQSDGDQAIMRYEPALERLVAELGVPAERAVRQLAAPFRHAAAPHVH